MNKQMTYDEFKEQLKAVRACLSLAHDNRKDSRCIERTVSLLVSEIEKAFRDTENNLRRWLHGESCFYTHPVTMNTIEIDIGDKLNAIYHFLLYVKALKDGSVSDEFLAYIAYVLCLGKECNS